MSSHVGAKCASALHEVTVENALCETKDLIKLRSGGRSAVPGEVFNYLQDRDLWLDKKGRQTFICKGCVQHVQQQIQIAQKDENPSTLTQSDEVGNLDNLRFIGGNRDLKINGFDELLAAIENKFTRSEIDLLAHAIGKKIANDVRSSCLVTSTASDSAGRRESMIADTYEKTWSKIQPSTLKVFLESIVDCRHCTMEEQIYKTRCLVKSAEAIYSATKPNFISSLALAENIIMSHYSRSRMCCNILGNIQASGHYTSILRMSKAIGRTATEFPSGDIIIAFDNNQIIGKTYRAMYQGKQPQSIITSMSVFQSIFPTKFQELCYIPTTFDSNGNVPMWLKRYEDFNEEANSIHRGYRVKYLKSRMEKIIAESPRAFEIDGHLEAGSDLQIGPQGVGLEYNRVASVQNSFNVFDQECLILNPNSTENIVKILDHLINKVNQQSPVRNWIVVVCDGLPYGICKKIIQTKYICPSCMATVDSNCIEKHMLSHNAEENIRLKDFERKYKKIVLRPGNGHYEITLVRCIFKVYFDILIKPIAQMLGFKTPKALEYCKKAHDHHKSWQILQIIFEALTDELLLYYVKERQEEGQEPTVDDYFAWMKKVPNPNYLMATHLVFSVLHPLFLFRAAVRQCNAKVALAAREKASVLFYGFNHPKYRNINASDLFFLLSMEDIIGAELAITQSIRRDGHQSGQGIDFILEERNALQKSWLVYDGPVPTPEHWRRTTCSMVELEKIRSAVLNRLSITEDRPRKRNINLQEEIMEARRHFRIIEILEPKMSADLSTFTSEKILISSQFLECIPSCEENRYKYYKGYLKGKVPALQNVSIFPCDELKKMSKTGLRNNITMMLKECTESIRSQYKPLFHAKASVEELQELHDLLENELADIEEAQNTGLVDNS